MGSFIEINDTLRINREQGFPEELDWEKHQVQPFKTEDFKDRVFDFKDKPAIRVYQQPPIRVFLVQEIDGKWLCWGHINILETAHNYQKLTTSGKFQISLLFSPEEMRKAQEIIFPNPRTRFFE